MNLAIDGLGVQDVRFTFQIDICIEAIFQVQIETILTLSDSTGASTTVDPETADDAAKEMLSTLVGTRIVEAVATEQGDLAIAFDSGHGISARRDPSYEAWNLTGPDGYRVISLPGGGLAVWSADRKH